ncbi:MAG: hypothetical protein KBE65_09255 [Phycisphaerae bacterium]|nr:hypothetical protein [Phycisphaerae bacterium]
MWKKIFCAALLLGILGATQAQAVDPTWIRAAYWDSRYPTCWAGTGEATRDALQAAGYEILDADQLKTWMTARISDKKLSVVVFIKDSAPDTVVETQSSGCTLRKYLNAGGKIVWYSDIPFYYQGHADGTNTTWDTAGSTAVLGFNAASGTWDVGAAATITEAGVRWGLTQTWNSARPMSASGMTGVTVLATDSNGNAPAWVKHFATNDTFRGFVRFHDVSGQPNVNDIMRVAEYVNLLASNPTPANGATGVSMGLMQWAAGGFGVYHNVYIGTTPELTEANLVSNKQTVLLYYYAMMQPGVTYYWRVDEVESDGEVRTGEVWKFTSAPTTAFSPSPRDGDKWIDAEEDLIWTAGQGAYKHAVYLSTDEAAVTARDASALVSASQVAATFNPGTLQAETTYYWAVDETTLAGVLSAGDVWQFTTIGPDAGGVKGEYFNNMTLDGEPALTRTDPSINFSWGEATPGDPIPVDLFSVRWTADLEIAVADTYTFTTSTDDGVRLYLNDELIINKWIDQGTTSWSSTPKYLEPGIYTLIMEYYENGGGAVAQLSWSTPTVARTIIPGGPLQPPVHARAVYPADGAENTAQDIALEWIAGEKATYHQVYFGDDPNAVAAATTETAGIYCGQQAADETTYATGELEWGKTYYWRVDEVNPTDKKSPWIGSVWSFTTADFIPVDDMERYNDVDNLIYDSWLDGYVDHSSGSVVGNLNSPFCELEYVHSGDQAMPVDYNNAVTPYFSEIVHEFDSAQNWTVNGVSNLTLFFRGWPQRFAETAPGQYTISSNTADIWGTADNFRFVYKKLNGNGSISAKIVSITGGSTTWAKPGVMIRESLDPSSTYALMHPTPDGRRAFQNRPSTAGSAISAHSATDAITLPIWVKVERSGNTFTAYYSQNGTTWIQQPADENTGTDASPNPQTIAMGNSVYIGLAVTSNNSAGGFCFAEFTDVITTGGATGDWTVANIGANPGNDQVPLYVGLEDSTGKFAMKTHPDAAAVNATEYTEWSIPLTDFTGVSRTKIKKMYIGAGNPNSPTKGGIGRFYIDDIRVTKP